MTSTRTVAASFADEMLRGFAAANTDLVRIVDGGVVRRRALPDGRVALVVGGGSGHYPGFAGVVGSGLAAGAACGNIFASPSAGQVFRVAQAAQRGGGVLLVYGNYMGDALNFGQAEERLRAVGIDTRTVRVTDDIASADASTRERRRGIAGDLVVFKLAGAAAESGANLDEVERIARRANERTRTLGVAFSGCTLPGATAPLFDVPAGRMAIGLGIHGEPGLDEVDVPTPEALAALLVSRIVAEAPAQPPSRVAIVLNGLGSLKYEELFVIFGYVLDEVTAAGLEVVAPEVGEFVTSLDMNGLSLTVTWLDPQLEALWAAPALSPAYRKIAVAAPDETTSEHPEIALPVLAAPEPNVSRATVVQVAAIACAVADMLERDEAELGALDALAGDGDHGIGMSRGAAAAATAAERVANHGGGLVALLTEAGDAWAERAGGTSGALWGIALTAAASSLARETRVDVAAAGRAAQAAVDAVVRLGGAQLGDKTLVDAAAPFAAELAAAGARGASSRDAWAAAATQARTAASGTAQLRPQVGRARAHVVRSIGHVDAGAESLARVITTIAEELASAS
ncbi:MAG: dihydroxyacetone kinase family protein [Pseudolysinimonas sp.]|uniref:dihydroxyacetone kinase family protein n=1 Tax=Pseudolysinimonas sp. TaxID=2680009 RepID=UPI003C786795